MRIIILVALCLIHARAVASGELLVTHVSPMGPSLQNPPYSSMYYYRTEVRNNSNRAIRIVWFEAYENHGGKWFGTNALNRVLRADDFAARFTEGAETKNAVIQPGTSAVCDVNWYSSNEPGLPSLKWAFIGVDSEGIDYFAEAEVPMAAVRVEESAPANK